MKFDLSEDQLTLQEAVRGYFRTRFPLPRVREVVEAAPGKDDTAPGPGETVWRGLMDLGLGAVVVPEEHGGLGLGVLDIAAASEIVGYSLGPVPLFGHVMGTLAVTRAGSGRQRTRWLPELATGRVRAGAIGQPGVVTKSGSSGTLLDLDATALDVAGADLLVVPVDGGLALVEVDDRVLIDDLPSIDRTRTLSRVRMTGHRAESLPLGGDILDWWHDVALTLLAADAMGGADRCVEMTLDYVKVRRQWGVPVGSFQAVKHQLADLALRVEPARGLYWFAAHALDRGPVADRAEASRAAALAKAHLTERFVEAGREAVELHGGIGYTWECDVHFFLKRALVDRAYLGEPRRLLGRVAELSGW